MAWLSGLIGGLIAAALAAWAKRNLKPARIDADGWHHLRPGWYLHVGLVGMILMALGFGSVTLLWLTHNPPDTRREWGIALFVAAGAVAAAGAAAFMGWRYYRQKVSWRGTAIRVRDARGRERVFAVADIARIEKRDGMGEYRFRFRDGSRFSVSCYHHGVPELVAALSPGLNPLA